MSEDAPVNIGAGVAGREFGQNRAAWRMEDADHIARLGGGRCLIMDVIHALHA
jgi:hypothetical protein